MCHIYFCLASTCMPCSHVKCCISRMQMPRTRHLGRWQRRFWKSDSHSVSRVRCVIPMISSYCPMHSTNCALVDSHTMTTKILFEDIIKAFHVFLVLHPESYPLILSLENHCSLPFQEIMATQLKSILGKNLYIPDERSLLGKLPSPEK